MKRRKFLQSMGAGCLLTSVPMPFLSSCQEIDTALINKNLSYIDPRLEKEYQKDFKGKKPLPKPELTGRNILLITSDQHHHMCMGYNNPKIKTPNLDRLAEMGIIFDRTYCPNPTSTPTRCSLITGKYPSQHGAWSLGMKMDEKVPTVGEYFQAAGYRTSLIGKAHFQPLQGTEDYPTCEAYPVLQDLDFWKKFNGPYYGFDHVELTRNHTDEAHVGQHYALWMEENGAKDWRNWFQKPTGTHESQHNIWNIPEKFHYDTWIAEQSIKQLEKFKKKNEPFFLWSSFFDPHPSYLVPEPWASMYKPEDMDVPEITPGEFDDMPPQYAMTQVKGSDFNSMYKEEGQTRPNWVHGASYQVKSKEQKAINLATYYGMISMMDHYIGKILDALDRLDLTQNTAIVFTTDHGNYLGQHGLNAKAIHHYEDLLRVPFVATLPDCQKPGTRSDAMVSLVDVAPTFLSLAGIRVPMSMAGKDQSHVWTGEVGEGVVRDHAIIENRFQPTKFYAKAYVNKRYKLVIYMNQTYGELFDLEQDPTELVNLWDHPEAKELKMELMLKMLHAEQMKEPEFMPRIAVA